MLCPAVAFSFCSGYFLPSAKNGITHLLLGCRRTAPALRRVAPCRFPQKVPFFCLLVHYGVRLALLASPAQSSTVVHSFAELLAKPATPAYCIQNTACVFSPGRCFFFLWLFFCHENQRLIKYIRQSKIENVVIML